MKIHVPCNHLFDMKYLFNMKYLKMLIERRLAYSTLNTPYMYSEKLEKYEMFTSLSQSEYKKNTKFYHIWMKTNFNK